MAPATAGRDDATQHESSAAPSRQSHAARTARLYAGDVATLGGRARAGLAECRRKVHGWRCRLYTFQCAVSASVAGCGRPPGGACPTALADVYLWTAVCLAGWHAAHCAVAAAAHCNAVGRHIVRAADAVESIVLCRPFFATVLVLTVAPYVFYRRYLRPAAVRRGERMGRERRLVKVDGELLAFACGKAAVTAVYLGGFTKAFYAPPAPLCALVTGVLIGVLGKWILVHKWLVMGGTTMLSTGALLAWGYAQSALADPCYHVWMWAVALGNMVHVRCCVDDAARCASREKERLGRRERGQAEAPAAVHSHRADFDVAWWQWCYVVGHMWLHFYLLVAIFVRDQLATGLPKEPACARGWPESYETLFSLSAMFDGGTWFFHKFAAAKA